MRGTQSLKITYILSHKDKILHLKQAGLETSCHQQKYFLKFSQDLRCFSSLIHNLAIDISYLEISRFREGLGKMAESPGAPGFHVYFCLFALFILCAVFLCLLLKAEMTLFFFSEKAQFQYVQDTQSKPASSQRQFFYLL